MKYDVISVDGHVDLHWLPPKLFQENCSEKFKDLVPHINHENNWVDGQGGFFGLAQGTGATKGRKYVPGYQKRHDDHETTRLYTDGKRRPADPDLRVGDQDLDGVSAEVLYGMLGSTRYIKDTNVANEVIQIYNDWILCFQDKYPDRFRPLAVIPSSSLTDALNELERVIKLDKFAGIQLCNDDIKIPFYYNEWNRLWSICEEANILIHLHTTPPSMEWDHIPEHYKRARAAKWITGFTMTAADTIMEIMFGAVLTRYPNLKIVFAETGIGWLPYLIDRMDLQWTEKYHDIDLKDKPSDLWKRQCYCSFQLDEIGIQHLDILGEGNVMWANDFPHSEGTWPHSTESVNDLRARLPENVSRNIICNNAMNLYNFKES